MAGRNMNTNIDDIANEFLSATDLAIQKEQDAWEKLVAKLKELIEIEYSLRGQRQKELDDIAHEIRELHIKLEAATELKERKKLEAKLKKAEEKEKKKKREKEQKEEESRQKELEKSRAKTRIEATEDAIKKEGYSLKKSWKLNVAEALDEVALSGGLGSAIQKSLAGAGKKVVGAAQQALTKGVDDAMTIFQDKASKINARLQGTSKTFNQMNDIFERNLGASPFVRYADSIDNLSELVDKGVAYNVEQRAFLQTMTNKIATTFDAFDSNLLKIIRIQQEDSTVYRMGAEAQLTKFFNSNFQDSTYMSDVYDTVSQSIMTSVAQLGTAGGAEFEYNMLKWLGSLYSLGMSSGTLTELASAVNMLATGDVQGLAGSNLLNLLVMAANKGNIAYADLLTLGVNASNVNTLMSNIVAYWSELASTQNLVVRKQYADLFGLDMSDMIAIKNVKQSDLDNIYKNSFAYSDANKIMQELFGLVASRMHISELILNAYQNVLTGIGTTIASSPGMAGTWLINNLIKDATGGINIPFITALGTGIGLETDLNSLINLGLVGAGTMGQIGNVISSISNKGGLNLDSWNATNMTTHGAGTAGIVTGVLSTTSQLSFIGNTNSGDIYDSSLHAAYDNVDTTVAGEAVDDAELMQKAITDSLDPNVKAILDLLNAVTTGSAIRVKVEEYGLTSF